MISFINNTAELKYRLPITCTIQPNHFNIFLVFPSFASVFFISPGNTVQLPSCTKLEILLVSVHKCHCTTTLFELCQTLVPNIKPVFKTTTSLLFEDVWSLRTNVPTMKAMLSHFQLAKSSHGSNKEELLTQATK